MTRLNKILLIAICAVILAGSYFLYMAWAFPGQKCAAAKHLATNNEGDCYGCHVKATPRVAMEWYESKHGVTLVRCQTCHGMPDGSGAMVFTAAPGTDVCAKCHSMAIQKMEAKFGRRGDCVSCHAYHQSPIHGEAYKYRLPATKTAF